MSSIITKKDLKSLWGIAQKRSIPKRFIPNELLAMLGVDHAGWRKIRQFTPIQSQIVMNFFKIQKDDLENLTRPGSRKSA